MIYVVIEMAAHANPQIHIENHYDITQNRPLIKTLLMQDVKLHFVDITHQGLCNRPDHFNLLRSESPSIRIITINEHLREAITELISSLSEGELEEEQGEGDTDSIGSSIGATYAGDKTCPVCGHNPDIFLMFYM